MIAAAAAAPAPPPLAEEPSFSAKPLSRASSKKLVPGNNNTLFLPSFLPNPSTATPQTTCNPILHLLLQNPLPNTHTHAPTSYSADSRTRHTLTGPDNPNFFTVQKLVGFLNVVLQQQASIRGESPTDLLDVAHSPPKTKEMRLNMTQ